MNMRLTPEQLEEMQERARVAIRDKWRTDYASFTHNARTIEDIPVLLAEIDRLRSEMNDLERFSNDHLVWELIDRDREDGDSD